MESISPNKASIYSKYSRVESIKYIWNTHGWRTYPQHSMRYIRNTHRCLFILIDCLCFLFFLPSNFYLWVVFHTFIVNLPYVFLFNDSFFTLYILPTSPPFTFHCQTLIWVFVFNSSNCQFTLHPKIRGVKRGTNVFLVSIVHLCFAPQICFCDQIY